MLEAHARLARALQAAQYAQHDAAQGARNTPLFTQEGPAYYQQALAHNRRFALPPTPGPRPYQTELPAPLEVLFRAWVATNHVPFDPSARLADYDMRGYWQQTRGQGWKPGQHFPDTFKTPYDASFSHESKYATRNNPFVWQDDALIDRRTGQIVFQAR
jgi:hypothetical protein